MGNVASRLSASHHSLWLFSRVGNEKGSGSLLHDKLRSQLREKQGTKPESTVGIADSQSVKTTEKIRLMTRRLAS